MPIGAVSLSSRRSLVTLAGRLLCCDSRLCLGVPAPSARRDSGAFRRACNGVIELIKPGRWAPLALPRLLRPFFKSIGDGTTWRRASRTNHASDRSRDE
uniref:Secreted protein n=1 Tax=Oryza rufipogon TaxID=4529 RepID=A0A0E0QZK2_ORYRU